MVTAHGNTASSGPTISLLQSTKSEDDVLYDLIFYHSHIKRQDLPLVLTKVAAKSYKLEQPILRCQSASRETVSLIRHPGVSDHPNSSILRPPRSRP